MHLATDYAIGGRWWLWAAIAGLIGLIVGWFWNGWRRRKWEQVSMSTSSMHDTLAEVGTLRSRVGELEPVVGERDRLQGLLSVRDDELATANNLVAQHEADVAAMRATVGDLEGRLAVQRESATAASARATAQIGELTADRDRFRGVLGERETELAALRQLVEEHQSSLAQANVRQAELEASLADVSRKLTKAEDSLTSANRVIAVRVPREDYDATIAERNRLHGVIAEKDAELAGLRAALSARDGEIGRVQGLIGEHTSSLVSTRSRIAELEEQLAQAGAAAAARVDRAEHDDVVADRDRVKWLLGERDAEVAHLQGVVAERDHQIGSVHSLVGEHESSLALTRSRIDELEGQLAATHEAIGNRVERDQHEAAIGDRDNELARVNALVGDRDRELAELRGRVAELDASLAAASRDAESGVARAVHDPIVAERDRLRGLLAERDDELTRVRAAAAQPAPAVAPSGPVQGFATPFDPDKAEQALGRRIQADDLKVVEGIGPAIEQLCHGRGIRTWHGLSETPVSDLQRMLDDGGSRFRVHDPASWPRQAGMLHRGEWEAFRRYTDELNAGREGGGEATGTRMMAEGGRVLPAAQWDAGRAERTMGRRIAFDDLKVVEGIGPMIERLCHDGGIRTWQALSETEVSRLQQILDAAGPRYRIHNPATWPRQAGMLARGKWDEFKAYTDALTAGRE